jgi:hypothetical protein
MKKQARHGRTGRYGFDGDMTRKCTCGHELGVHTPGGGLCIHGDFTDDGQVCECQRFKPAKAKKAS